jgi:hypothetical protein
LNRVNIIMEPTETIITSDARKHFNNDAGPPLWSSGQDSWLRVQRSRVRSPALPDSLRRSEFETGTNQPLEDVAAAV